MFVSQGRYSLHGSPLPIPRLSFFAGLLNDDCLESLRSCSKAPAEGLRAAVFTCVDVLLAEAFDKYPNTPMLVINPLLVRAGLIKSEDKAAKAPADIRDMVVVLAHACQQAYFPRYTKAVVRGVVTKENVAWDKCPLLRTQLLQVLYS